MTIARVWLWLESWVAREFEVGEADSVDEDLVGAYADGGFEADGAAGGYEVILIDAVAADAEAAHERAVLIESDGTGKEDHSAFVTVGRTRLIALRARVLHILQK